MFSSPHAGPSNASTSASAKGKLPLRDGDMIIDDELKPEGGSAGSLLDDDDEDADEESDDMDDGGAGGAGSGGGEGSGRKRSGSNAGGPPAKKRNGGGPGSRGGGANEGKGGSGIVRVNRACTNCRRMKMRCVGGDSPPCKRCAHTGQSCVMEKPNKPGPVPGSSSRKAAAAEHGNQERDSGRSAGAGNDPRSAGDDRIRFLENQMSSMQNTLMDLVSTLKAGAMHPTHSGSSSSAYEHISPASASSLPGYPHAGGPTPPTPMGFSSNSDPGMGPYNAYAGMLPGMDLQRNMAMMAAGGQVPGGVSMRPGQQGRSQSFMSTQSAADALKELAAGYPGAGPAVSNARGQMGRQQGYTMPVPAFGGGAFNNGSEYLAASPSVAGSYQQQSTPAQQQTPWQEEFASGMAALVEQSMEKAQRQSPAQGPSPDAMGFPKPSHLGSSSSSTQFPATSPGPHHLQKQSHLRMTPQGSGVNSPAASDNEDEDPLGPSSIMAPLSSMAGLAEAAVERAKIEKASGNGKAKVATPVPDFSENFVKTPQAEPSTPASTTGPVESEAERAAKKRKLTDGSSARVSFATPAVPEYALIGAKGEKVKLGNLPAVDLPSTTEVVRTSKGKEVRRHVHAFPDIVALGLVQETEARELFSLFFEGCHAFIPIFDLERDTWESLRDRSPFLISSIVAIGARVRDGGGPMSETQRVALEHARKIAISTLFTPVCRIEAVQAMILIAAFNDTGWVPANYAGLLAIDMGLNKFFPKLLQTGMGAGKMIDSLEDERDLVVGSRCWLCLYMIEHQMAFGTGRPALLREDECIAKCRLLLQHPLSIPSDVRLVSTVELMALRAPLHVVLTNSPDEPVDQATVIRLQQANADFDRWQTYWDRVLAETFGRERGDFYRESLATQREYSSLFINSQLLRGVKEAADVKRMPEDKRELAIKAMKNAQNCLEIALRGKNYRKALKFAVHYTHVCAAFAASFLVRIARLFPKELDLRKTAKDVEELATLLSEIPAGRYSRSLRLILRRARKQKVMPPPSMPSSPNRAHATLPSPRMSAAAVDQFLPGANQGMQSTMYPSSVPNMSPAVSHTSPNVLMALGGRNESPQSNPEAFQYDFDFAQELWNRAGDSHPADEQLPLYLNGESLGNPDTMDQAFNLENFFVPPDLDMRLGDLGAFPTPGGGDAFQNLPWPAQNQQQDMPPDTWW